MRKFSVFFLTKTEDEFFSYSRSESIAMTCMNKSVISEDNQCDIAGVHFIKPWLQNSHFNEKVIENALEKCPRENLQFIFAAYTTDYDQSEIKDVFGLVMSKNRIKRAKITFIEMIRAFCITKEKYDDFHKQKALPEKLYIENPEPSESTSEGLVEPFGNDLETFTANNLSDAEENTTERNSFFVTMLTHQEKKQLAIGDVEYCRTFWKYQTMGMNPG